MADINDDLWQAFLSEVAEQLDRLEESLTHVAVDKMDVSQLFRDFHTVKSSCGMFELSTMKQVAHISEDYLDLLRKGKATLDKAAANILFEAVEWLKESLAYAMNTRQAPEQNAVLIHNLQGLVARSTIAVAAGEQATDTTRFSFATLDPITHAVVHEPVQREDLLELAASSRHLLSSCWTGVMEQAVIRKAVGQCRNIAEVIGLSAIASLLDTLRPVLMTETLSLAKPQDLRHFAELFDRLRVIESGYDLSCGVREMVVRLRHTLLPELQHALRELLVTIDLSVTQAHAGTVTEFDPSLLSLGHMVEKASVLSLKDTAGLLRFVYQILRSLQRNEITPASLALVASCLSDTDDVWLGASDQDIEHESRLRRDRLSVGLTQLQSATEVQSLHSGVALDIAPRLLEQLTVAQKVAVHDAHAEGAVVCEIGLDMDGDALLLDDLVTWITMHGDVLHNISDFAQELINDKEAQHARILFLVIFTIDADAISAALEDIDVERAVFDLKICQKKDTIARAIRDLAVHDSATAISRNVLAQNFRVRSADLDELVSRIGEMVLIRNTLGNTLNDRNVEHMLQQARAALHQLQIGKQTAEDLRQLGDLAKILISDHDAIRRADNRLHDSILSVHEKILDLRGVSLSTVFNRLPPLLRKLTIQNHANVRLELTGGDLLVDKSLLGHIQKPLNALVKFLAQHCLVSSGHGQNDEESVLVIQAALHNGLLRITLVADGNFIDATALRKCLPDSDHELLSLVIDQSDVAVADRVLNRYTESMPTHDAAVNAFVQLGALRMTLNEIGGNLELLPDARVGQAFVLVLPLSVAMQSVVIGQRDGAIVGLPCRNVIHSIKVSDTLLENVRNRTLFQYDKRKLEVHDLGSLMAKLGLSDTSQEVTPAGSASQSLLVLQGTQKRIAVLVDEVAEARDVYVPELEPALRAIPAISGATLLGSGRLVYILNIEHLVASTVA